MTTIEEIPITRRVAEAWAASDPAAKCACLRCEKDFPVLGIGGVPTVICPFCGFAPDDRVCGEILGLLDRRKAEPKPEPAAEAVSPQSTVAPPGLDDVIGNAAAVAQIRVALDAHRMRMAGDDGKSRVLPHLLLTGPGGTGKTMLSEIVARELGRPIRLQMGQSLNNPARVAEVLLSLKAGDVLYIDEIHGLKPACQEALYRAMEDGVLVRIVKTGVGEPVKLPPFTLIGSTTDEWALLPSFLQRFKYRVRLERMTTAELGRAIAERAKRRGWALTDEAAAMIAERSHGTPRLAVGLLDGCMDTAIAGGSDLVDPMIVGATCETWQIDRLGLDKVARKYLTILADAGGGPVRLNVLSTKLDGLSRRTVETRIEPDLVYLGLITKDSDGRRLTAAGYEHLKKEKRCA